MKTHLILSKILLVFSLTSLLFLLIIPSYSQSPKENTTTKLAFDPSYCNPIGSTVPGPCELAWWDVEELDETCAFLFTGTSTAVAVSHTWDFGDGTIITTTEPTVEHTYCAPGTYQVCHTVEHQFSGPFSCCCELEVDEECPDCTPPCEAEFSITDVEDCRGEIFQFVVDCDIPGVDHFWDFGDGTTSTEANPFHRYTNINTKITPSITVTHIANGVAVQHEVILPVNAILIGDGGNASLSSETDIITGNLLFPGDAFTEPCDIIISGYLIIDKPFTFENCTFKVAGGCGGIDVYENLTLKNTINTCHPDCGGWRGIEVFRNVQLIVAGSAIEKSSYAIHLNSSNGAPTLDITSTLFQDNFVGIYIPKFQEAFNLTAFNTNTFSVGYSVNDFCGLLTPQACDKSLPDGFYAGICSCAEIDITLNDPVAGNIFYGTANGIVLENPKDVLIRGNAFKNHRPGPFDFDGGFGVFVNEAMSLVQNGSMFENCRRGIFVGNGSAPTLVELKNNSFEEFSLFEDAGIDLIIDASLSNGSIIENNGFQNGFNGIYGSFSPSQLSELTIRSNRFDGIGHVGIWLNSDSGPLDFDNIIVLDNTNFYMEADAQAGIFLESIHGVNVLSNQIDGGGGGGTTDCIRAYASKAVYYGNNLINSYRGFSFAGECTNPAGPNDPNSAVIQNNMGFHNIGIYIAPNSNIGPQPCHFNAWNPGTFTTSGLINDGNPASLFSVFCLTPPEGPPNPMPSTAVDQACGNCLLGGGGGNDVMYAYKNHDETELLAKAFPNPAIDKITIELTSPVDEQGSLIIYDGTGQMVYSKQIQLESELSRQIEIVSDSWSAGVYYFEFNGDTNRTFNQFVVK